MLQVVQREGILLLLGADRPFTLERQRASVILSSSLDRDFSLTCSFASSIARSSGPSHAAISASYAAVRPCLFLNLPRGGAAYRVPVCQLAHVRAHPQSAIGLTADEQKSCRTHLR